MKPGLPEPQVAPVLVSTACLFRPWVKLEREKYYEDRLDVSTACLFRPWVKPLNDEAAPGVRQGFNSLSFSAVGEAMAGQTWRVRIVCFNSLSFSAVGEAARPRAPIAAPSGFNSLSFSAVGEAEDNTQHDLRWGVSTACLFRPWVKPTWCPCSGMRERVSTACLFRPWVKPADGGDKHPADGPFQQPVFFGRG